MPDIYITKFIVPDLKDERDARDAYTVEQGLEIFNLPPWVGCRSLKDRFNAGIQIIHDSLFFVLLVVWYTGMRREEVCKLLISDVRYECNAWIISVQNTVSGRLKNAASRRAVVISDELIRLGFVKYITALRDVGETAIFPELYSERINTRKGDVFYRIWWIYLIPLLKLLKRGQAMHAARHMFDTELKELGVSIELRQDATGRKGNNGETRRYSKPVSIKKAQKLFNKVPIVTNHIPTCQHINLLPPELRRPRPARKSSATA